MGGERRREERRGGEKGRRETEAGEEKRNRSGRRAERREERGREEKEKREKHERRGQRKEKRRAHLHRVETTRNDKEGSVIEILLKLASIQRCTHHNQFQIFSLFQHLICGEKIYMQNCNK